MSLTKTPICDFGKQAENFKLKSTDGKFLKLEDLKGKNGTLIMFICNHCPYVKAIISDVVKDCNVLTDFGVNSVAICSNDVVNYPEDSFENMGIFSKKNKFNFSYLHDETQEVAKKYDAVCTPDFFGFNKNFELQYRGRHRELKDLKPTKNDESELLTAMKMIAETNEGPKNQSPSMGCNIKWF